MKERLRVKWICPNCGSENWTVQVEGLATFWVELDGEDIQLGEQVDFHIVVPALEPVYYHCPRCDEMFTRDQLEAAIERWIQKLKKEDFKRYTEILANRFQST
jgi:predicted RNA-binding Zn-ribbon protein involved in translation (DUF1610 family)